MPQDEFQLYGLYLQAAAFLAGPLLALIPILAWELGIKPRREAKQLARTLRREIQYNLDLLEAADECDPRHSIIALPSRFKCSTIAFNALASRTAELPTSLGTKMIFLYNGFWRLNLLAEDHDTLITQYKLTQQDTAGSVQYSGHLEMLAEAIRDQRQQSLRGAREVLEQLDSIVPGEKREISVEAKTRAKHGQRDSLDS